jgi:hypothetical protein
MDNLTELLAMAICEFRGFGYYTDPMEGGQDAFDISQEAYREADYLRTKFDIRRR